MALAVVGGAFLSAFLDVVFDRLASPEVVNLIRGKKLDKKLLQKLETTLRVVRAVLDDAEKKQITDSNVTDWLTTLKDVVYEADDLLDELFTKAATQNKVRNVFPHFSNRKKITKLEDIVVRLESLLKLKENLDLKEMAAENSVPWKVPSTSLEDASHIYGRDKDKEAIIKLLLENSCDGEEVSVIPIVGMGGVGKTTLAQLVYNDDNLKEVFDFKAWVCVSEEFDVLRVTKIILEAITKQHCKINDLNVLHLDLMDKLKDKKFLIVLDDVWIQDYVNWSLLKKPFQRGTKGSKILVTTRNDSVASVVRTVQAYHLNQLSNDDCWLVFANHASLYSESSENSLTLEKIGREIVQKCNGLPLAAQSLGGMLRRKHDVRDWNSILNSDIWDLECNIIPALRISYHYLPPQLKRCFVYCSLYPKDYEFEKDELILLWMAEDLLKPVPKGKTLEEVGHDYFEYLVSRSFFQRLKFGDFVMHDLMHDLATSLGKEFYLRSEELGKETKIDVKIRHLSFTKVSHAVSDNFEVFDKVKFLRTFLSVINFDVAPFNNEKALCILLSKLMYLRVLSFSDFQSLDALPDSIGKMIHLRYLNLSRTSVSTLPESLCKLYNLEILMLNNCSKLTKLPNGMQNLVNLRHLAIWNVPLEEMPRGMGNLNRLQQLAFFIVGTNKENGIKELGGLSNLQGSLLIKNLENVTTSDEALEARIIDKKHINWLQLEWTERNNNKRQFQIETDVLCKLQPHQELKRLTIRGYQGTRFPDWVGNCYLHSMTRLYLDNCNKCDMLPSLGQLPSLKELHISELNSVKAIDIGFYKNQDCSFVKPFSPLEYLHINNMLCWEVWSSFDSDAFPLLKVLNIRHCPKFRGDLPNRLPSLESLVIEDMPCWETWSSLTLNAFPLLNNLDIRSCPKLRGDLPNQLPALKRLLISDCELLVSTLSRAPVLEDLVISKSNKVLLDVFPLSLEFISVKGSPMVEYMIKVINSVQPTSLRSLDISDSSSAISFPCGRLPASLKILTIRNIKNLEFPLQHKHELLVRLQLTNSCDSLTSLPLITFPNLKEVGIGRCENLESLLVSESLMNLSYFRIDNCPNFVSFPREGLPAPNLTHFYVENCHKLKALPNHMSALLPKLEYLTIENCPEIESFPERGMPPNLRSIKIINCEKLLRDIARPSVDKLTDLTLGGPFDAIKSFPKEGLLPTSLTSLCIANYSSLETFDCRGLIHLTSLQKLEIRRCKKLENMDGEKLPDSLIKFEISDCPLLQKRMKHRQIWPQISHIPGIRVDYRWI